jgi:uncharacterized protein YcaQ
MAHHNHRLPEFDLSQVVKLWLQCQGMADPSKNGRLTKRSLTKHLENTGGLQLDSVNVLDRAHYLTLWSRFGCYDKRQLDQWVYRDKLAFEYWGHEASLLPTAQLPLSRRRMKNFPPPHWARSSWWSQMQTSALSQRRVLKRLAEAGPLESADFRKQPRAGKTGNYDAWSSALNHEDKRSLRLLWHSGKIAVSGRRHFRKVYELAERYYPPSETASTVEFEDSWLIRGLRGNGIALESHLTHYITAPLPSAAERARIIARNIRQKKVVHVRVRGFTTPFLALPEHLDQIDDGSEPRGTMLVCPFDSLLWQRRRALDLLGFRYRIEIYTPARKREFGYYVLPILHNGRLVGRLDPGLDRESGTLEIRSIMIEPGFTDLRSLRRGLLARVEKLANFVGAERLKWPGGWKGV